MSVKRCVLLVDDDPSICEAITEVLETQDIQVRAVSSGREGIEALRGGYEPNVILLDLMMPGTDGLWFCAEMEKHPELKRFPVIVLSACGRLENRASGLSVTGLLRKPIGIEELLETVEPFVRAA